MSSRLVLRPLTRRLPLASPAYLQTVSRSGTYSVSHINPSSSHGGGNITTTTPLRIITRRSYSLLPGGMGPQKQQQQQQQQQPTQDDQESNSSNPKNPSPKKLPSFTKILLISLAACTCTSWILYEDMLGLRSPPTLNTATFVPYTIVAREQVSSTAFILSVEPAAATATAKKTNGDQQVLQKAWKHGLWCVEIKQPQLQVARDYTPLPAPVGEELEEMERGRLRFLIRKMDGGEVSSYLSKLKVGDKVELRGPHLGFDVAKRVGGLVRSVDGDDHGGEGEGRQGQKQGQVVFLAGGTGIAPALQVARRLYGPVYERGTGKEEGWKLMEEDMPTQPPKMTIVWANRFREDCPDCEDLEALRRRGYLPPSPVAVTGGIMPYLQDIKARHPEQFNFACTVDTEKKFIDAKTILDAITSTSTSTNSNTKSLIKSTTMTTTTTTTDPSCPLHSSSVLVYVSDRQDHEAQCKCPDHHAKNNGKNLLMVSGPDGFIAQFAAPKAWSEGLERQGHVGGVAGELMRKGKVSKEEWMVLKL